MRFWRPYQPALDEAYRSLAGSFGEGNLVPNDEELFVLEEQIANFPEKGLGHVALVPSASVGFFLLLKVLRRIGRFPELMTSNFMYPMMYAASSWAGVDVTIVDCKCGWEADLWEMEKDFEMFLHTDLVGQQCKPVCLPGELRCATTIQDGSQVFGKTFDMWADVVILSFGATKNPFGLIGAVASRNQILIDRVRELRSVSIVESLGADGLNFNLSVFQTALLGASLNYFNRVEETCARIVARYKANFRERIVHIGEVRNSSYASMYVGDFDDSFMRRYVRPLRENSDLFPVSCQLSRNIVCLPVYADMSSEDVAFVIEKVRRVVGEPAQKRSC